MKKSILTIVLAVFAITAFAQDQVRIPNGYQGFLEYGNTWHVFDKEMPNNINLSTTHGFYFSDHIYAGIGIAFDFNNDRVIVPVYANMRYVFVNNKTVSPVLTMRLGSYMSSNMGAYGDLGIGVRFASKRDFALSVILAGTYYDQIKDIESHYNNTTQTYEDQKIIMNPSGISLRIGIEW